MMNQMNSYERFLFRRERASGIEEGKTEGAAEILQSLLERRFGTLPDWASIRLSQADTMVLKQWSFNLLDAQRLEDVFGA